MMSKGFNIGDRVLIVRPETGGGFLHSTYGTVCDIDGRMVGVRHDIKDRLLHNCHGNCDENHGYYYFSPFRQLRVVQSDERGTLDIDSINELI